MNPKLLISSILTNFNSDYFFEEGRFEQLSNKQVKVQQNETKVGQAFEEKEEPALYCNQEIHKMWKNIILQHTGISGHSLKGLAGKKHFVINIHLPFGDIIQFSF